MSDAEPGRDGTQPLRPKSEQQVGLCPPYDDSAMTVEVSGGVLGCISGFLTFGF